MTPGRIQDQKIEGRGPGRPQLNARARESETALCRPLRTLTTPVLNGRERKGNIGMGSVVIVRKGGGRKNEKRKRNEKRRNALEQVLPIGENMALFLIPIFSREIRSSTHGLSKSEKSIQRLSQKTSKRRSFLGLSRISIQRPYPTRSIITWKPMRSACPPFAKANTSLPRMIPTTQRLT